jgi:hypothetical protein
MQSARMKGAAGHVSFNELGRKVPGVSGAKVFSGP